MMTSRTGAALGAAAMLVALAATWVVGRGLACAALRGDASASARGYCGYPARSTPEELPQQMSLYHAVIDTLYRPARYISPQRLGGVLLLQSQPVDAAEYLDDPAISDSLRDAVQPLASELLVDAFRRANAGHEPVTNLWRDGPTYLDTSTVRVLLDANDSTLRADPLVRGVLTGFPIDSLPEILALSRPGADSDGAVALMFATLRSRRSREPDHLEAAAFIVARRDGFIWTVTAEIPIPRRRLP